MSKSNTEQPSPCLREFVRNVVGQYLVDMGNTPPDDLHRFILREVERPLIEAVLEHTGGNQSRSAAGHHPQHPAQPQPPLQPGLTPCPIRYASDGR